MSDEHPPASEPEASPAPTPRPPTNLYVGELVLRALAAVGFGASALLLWDYTRPAPTFCGAGGGCDAVRLSKFAYPLGIPMPLFGIAFFGAVLVLTLVPESRLRRLLVLAGGLGAVFAAALVWIQAQVVRAFCPYCMIVDVAAVGIFVLSLLLHGRSLRLPGRWATGSALAALLAAAVPFVYGVATRSAAGRPGPFVDDGDGPPRMPAAIAREQLPGVATIVEFSDFECPHCRAQHEVFNAVLREYGGRVRLVRKHVLFVRGHANAETAARTACCADEAGRGEEMADLLFRSEDLSTASCERFAESLGLDLAAFRACVSAARITTRLAGDDTLSAELGVRALPTYWIGARAFEGRSDPVTVRAAIEAALAATQSGG